MRFCKWCRKFSSISSVLPVNLAPVSVTRIYFYPDDPITRCLYEIQKKAIGSSINEYFQNLPNYRHNKI